MYTRIHKRHRNTIEFQYKLLHPTKELNKHELKTNVQIHRDSHRE